MTEPLFFKRPSGLSAGEIATLTGAAAHAPGPLDRRITGIAALGDAGPDDLVFLDNPRYAEQARATRAGICITAKRFVERLPVRPTVLIARDPYRAFVAVA